MIPPYQVGCSLFTVVSEYDDLNNLDVEYVYGLDRISQDRGGSDYFYLSDGQGSVRGLTDNTGTLTDTYEYYAFGEILNRTGSTENEFMYVGEQMDANTGYYYLRARWMNPGDGRFVSVDPFAGDPNAPVSLHRYLYANASPVSMYDPSGEMTLTEVGMTIHASMFLASVAIPVLSVDRFVKKVEAYFAERPLILIINPGKTGGELDRMNLDLVHEHIFFDKDDKSDNVGFVCYAS